ncbi:MAG: hypothetical protein AAB575_00385 [Patescibacteria group bacterium]
MAKLSKPRKKTETLDGLPLYSIFRIKGGDAKEYQKCEFGCWVIKEHPKRQGHFRVGKRLQFKGNTQIVFVMDYGIEVPHHDDWVKAVADGMA